MKYFKKVFLLSFLLGLCLLPSAPIVLADEVGFGSYDNINKPGLPFKYFQREPNDWFTLIHGGGFKIFNLEEKSDEVAVMGPLATEPIAVSAVVFVTDGKKLIIFHALSQSLLDPDIKGSLGQIIRQNLNLDSSIAVVYYLDSSTETKDFVSKTKSHFGKSFFSENLDRIVPGWSKYFISQPRSNKSCDEVIVDIMNALEIAGIPREYIHKNSWIVQMESDEDLRYLGNSYLMNYSYSKLFVAIRISEAYDAKLRDNHEAIKLTSISPAAEDIYGFKGTQMKIIDCMINDYNEKFVKDNQLSDLLMDYDELVKGDQEPYVFNKKITEQNKFF